MKRSGIVGTIERLESRIQNHQEELVAIHSLLHSTVDRLVADGDTLAINHEAFFALVGLTDRQQERIGRLEQIIFAMSGGSESSLPDDGEKHTHWVYPANGAKDLVEEIKKGGR